MRTVHFLGVSFLALAVVNGAPTLRDVGDIGKVVDTQGVTSVRAKMGNRWTGAGVQMPVKPGDWIRTDVRGANALQVRLVGGSELILGPGTLIEMVDGKSLKLVRGELEVTPGEGAEIRVQAGDGETLEVGKAKVLRRKEGKEIEVLEKEPNWLKGFKGTAVSESMGQLLANVDGRNTPLTLGYHKVTVDIRDQIARTTIEESFVNHTDSRLEGVFYFPLPQDASISGFGMWINGELVEADVVEKQRAREIYETILREKRDPGLLEWTGGNLFKARVFPIFGHSEKRIKITYTQVLPFRKGSYRYSYALQSEMLKANPLRELAVNVRVHSALPIKKFACTSHDARVSATKHSAQAEFTAQEYTPESDFEVEIEIDQTASPVTLIPHRRGEDGYFMAMITPPDEGAGWEREMVEDGEPLDLIILADTSGSMDKAARENQDALIGALLGSLGEEDSFSIATCDSEVRWLSVEKFAGTREAYVELARDWLAARRSLGWSDLDKAFASVMESVRENTQVIYIGDGVVTTGDADPVAFANRLRQLYAGKTGTFHAVAPTGQYEPGVLKAIASLGGGSVRRIAGSDTPSAVATKLLAEMSAPGIRDLSISFRGIRTARVYPETLPNLAAGKQQIVIGRYLPEGEDQQGEILVKGIRDGRDVEFKAAVTLKDAESGNSFIPRLWARMHLDVLLGQGRTPEVKEDVIALSEEFHIMTPYTSFLVLESDADRERFKVKRRFRMRDGEKFFAEGRDAANYELLQKQMRVAGTWRLNLQRGFLRELMTLGRKPLSGQLLEARERRLFDLRDVSETRPTSGWNKNLNWKFEGDEERSLGRDDDYADAPGGGNDLVPDDPMEQPESAAGEEYAQEEEGWDRGDGERMKESLKRLQSSSESAGASAPSPDLNKVLAGPGGFGNRYAQDFMGDGEALRGFSYRDVGRKGVHRHGKLLYGEDGYHWFHSMGDLESLFPALAGPRYMRPNRKGHPWPKEAVELADSLLRVEPLAAMRGEGGVDVRLTMTHYNMRFERVNSIQTNRVLIGKGRWVANSESNRSDTVVNWWDGEERGVIGKGFQLGRARKANAADALQFRLGLNDSSVTSLASSWSGYEVKLKKEREGQVTLVLSPPGDGANTMDSYLIDTERNVLLSHETKIGGKVTGRVEFSKFVKAGGVWWATRSKATNGEGKVNREEVIDVRELGGDEFLEAYKEQLAGKDGVIVLNESLPTVEAAKQAGIDKKRSFESELVLLQHFALSQQWERAGEHFQRMEKLAKDRPGFRWLEMRFLAMKRRNEEAKQAVFSAARDLEANPVDGEFALAAHLRAEAGRVMAANEPHELLELLEPVYARMPSYTWALKEWEMAMMWSLQNIGRPDGAIAMAKLMAKKYGWDANAQTQYANMLANQGDRPASIEYFEKLLRQPDWNDAERESFRYQLIAQFENSQMVAEVRDHMEQLIKENPEHTLTFVHQRYLSALIRTDDVDRAYDLIESWLGAAVKTKRDEGIDEAVRAKFEAAMNVLLGSGHGVRRSTIEERFRGALSGGVRRFALDETYPHFADRIMGDYRFQQTDEVREIRAYYAGVLQKRGGELPMVSVQRLVHWVTQNDPAVEKGTWHKIVEPLIERWSEEKVVMVRDQWAQIILGVLAVRIGVNVQTDFLRRQLKEGSEKDRPRYALQLFNSILMQAWSEAAEAEAFDLLYVVGAANEQILREEGKEEDDRSVIFRAAALLRLNDWVTKSGYNVLYGAVEKKEELSRTELAAASRERWKEIRERLSARLRSEIEEREGVGSGFAQWLTIERLYVNMKLGRDAGVIAAECWEYLGNFDFSDASEERTWSGVILIGRYLGTLEYLASRPDADEVLVGRVLAFHDVGIQASPEIDGWKHRKYRLLVALDRPHELKESLRGWIRPGEADTRWRIALGYLQAELNEIEAAIAEFEAVEKADELRPKEYRVLAGWYLVRDQKENRERALVGYYGTMPDYQLSNLIGQRTAQIRQGFEDGVPEDLDPEVVTMMTVLLRKTQQPAGCTHQIGELYRYTKDFRLLECIPEGIIGHTVMEVYPYLQNLTSVHEHIRDEATADTVFGQMEMVRERAVTKVDSRGLDLLEMLVRRRASEVLNQPGQHLPKALEAMRRASDGDWEDGERKQMALFLYGLGRITQRPLADEQIREMAILHREEKADADRMEVGSLRGQLLWQYSGHDDAIEVMEFVLADVEDVHGGVMPYAAHNVLQLYLNYLVQRGQYARAEKEIFRILEQEVVKTLRYWLINRKHQLYIEALGGEGTVSLGKGEVLYEAAERLMVGELPKVDHELRSGVVGSLTRLYWSAHRIGIDSAAADARAFACGAFDELVPFETMNYQGLVGSLGSTLRDVLSPVEGLAFLIDRYEKEPVAFRVSGQDGWRRYGGAMADYRYHSKGGVGKLEPRLLEIVLDELRRDLRTYQGSSYSIYRGPNNSYFWKEKAGDFARVAEDVLKEGRKSMQTVVYVAQYFHDGLHLNSRAIDVLVDAYKRKLLDENGWALLVSYLEYEARWKEVVVYLTPLIDFRPDNLSYRTRLMVAYFHLGEKEKLVEVLDAIGGRWHEKGWWNEGTLGTVGATCYQTELWGRAVEYFDELIPMYRRARKNQGVGDGPLSHYYTMLANCHRELGDIPKAVEAASGAIVSWGSSSSNREQALGTLRGVLAGAQDLGAYVDLLEKEVSETGLENPIVRKALGQVYLERKDAEQAIRHLRLALESEPNDEQSHRSLVEAFDLNKDAEGAIAQILESVALSRWNISLFKELGERYQSLGREAEAERARTGIVEALPNESEGHAMLAEIREGQERWEDAVGHWEQVAEIRVLEPTGLNRLAMVQMKLGRNGEAEESLEKLLAKEWPSRFGNVHGEAQRMMGELKD